MAKRQFSSKRLDIAGLPQYCDFSCPHASFAPNDAVGACRKELAVYCNLLAKYNSKNARCAARDDRFGSSGMNRIV